MIKPNELRIGNYVWCLASVRGLFIPFGEVKILTLGFDKVETCLIDQIPAQVEEWPKYEYNRIDPIHLTPKWLEKFGFEYEKQTVGGFERWQNERIKLLDKKFSWSIGEYSPYILYVHQLQNLYFALTGEELTLASWSKTSTSLPTGQSGAGDSSLQ